MINHNKIKQLLAHVDRAEDNEIELECEFEPMTIELFNSEEIEEGQLGYSFDEGGQSLVGNEGGRLERRVDCNWDRFLSWRPDLCR